MNATKKKIVMWVILGIPALAMLGSAIGKLSGAAPVVEMFTKWNMGQYIFLIGMIELVSVLLLLIPKTQIVGLLLCNAYLGGAIVTHFQQDGIDKAVPAAVLLAFIWIGSSLRRPSLTEGLF